MPSRKPKDKLLTRHVQILFSEKEYFAIEQMALVSSAEGNINRFLRGLILQAIQPAEVVTVVSTAPVAE